VKGPDGSKAWMVECEDTVDDCIDQAGKLCPRGYRIALKDTEIENADTAGFRFGPAWVAHSGAKTKKKLMVQCRSED
jgi:hypothetical protein